MSILENIKFWNILGFKSFLGIFAVTKNVGWSTFSKYSENVKNARENSALRPPPVFITLYDRVKDGLSTGYEKKIESGTRT